MIRQAHQSTQPQQLVICKKCKHEFDLRANLQARQVGNDVQQVGVLCPNCDDFVHAYFETPDIVAARERLETAQQRYQASVASERDKRWTQYKFQQAAYRRTFDAEQQRWKRKRHIPEKAA